MGASVGEPVAPRLFWLLVPSVALLLAASGPFKPAGDDSSLPPLASFRDASGQMFVRSRIGSHFYMIGALWAICMPIQHIRTIRNRYPAIHRASGWVSMICSAALSVSGSLLPLRGMAFSHPDLFHVHKLRIGDKTLFAWPTFESITYPTSVALAVTAAPALYYAIKRDIPRHRRWATLMTWAGYLVPFQRVFMIVPLTLAALLPRLPTTWRKVLHVPQGMPEIHDAELAAFAWTTFMAALLSIALVSPAVLPRLNARAKAS